MSPTVLGVLFWVWVALAIAWSFSDRADCAIGSLAVAVVYQAWADLKKEKTK